MPEAAISCEHAVISYAPEMHNSKHRVTLRRKPDVRYKRETTREWDKLLREGRRRKQRAIITRREAAQNVQPILRDLRALLDEQNEPDFHHRPSDYAYGSARQIIENSYTHYLGSAPKPAVAPDGMGGLVVEWKAGRFIVRLIVAASEDGKSYVYSRGAHRSQVDHSASGLLLAHQLRTIFAD
jgi:hypothetical protein